VNQIRPREKEASTKRPAAAGDGTDHGQAAEPAISPSVKLHDTIATRLGAVKLPEGVTPEEIATLRFVDALHEDALRFMDMTEEDIQEEYRRAGKLHRYDPDKEWQKRYARIARLYRPPKNIAPHLDEYLKYLQEDEADEDGVVPGSSAAQNWSTIFVPSLLPF
jgi:hypothetical protein